MYYKEKLWWFASGLLIAFLAYFIFIYKPKPDHVTFTLILDTPRSTLHIVDEKGDEKASFEFEDEVDLTLRRFK